MLRGSVPTVNSGALHTFSRAPQANIPRSTFNRSHGCKTTFDEGYLVPIFVDEALPGDTFNLQLHAFARMATPIFPIMDNMYLETFFFSVPYRLVWDNWEKFNGYQVNPGDSTDYVVPKVTMPAVGGAVSSSLADYFGIPVGVNSLVVNSLFFRAYNLIWNEWFRDENLQDSVVVDKDDGPDTYADYVLLRRGKRYDYFTSCLPFPQKGPDVTLPLASNAPVIGNGGTIRMIKADNTPPTGGLVSLFGGASNPGLYVAGSGFSASAGTAKFSTVVGESGLVADLSAAGAVTINDLRLAFQTQKLYERDARGGTRYTEIIKSHFGVTSPDMRLQRPEYLGGGSSPVNVNPVAQTTQAAAPTFKDGLGNLGAYGVCAPKGHGFTYSATEHCLLIGLVCVRADLNYQQGLDRMWSRQTRLDFYWPALSHIGEQAVLNKEIYAQGTSADNEVFGYQERFAEYRYKPSVITGLFRSDASGSLDSWHLAQDFGALPVLNDEFIIEDAPMDRILAVPTEPHFLFDAFFSYRCARPMPVYSVPGLVDHF
jgi:hypothetical protein